MHSVSHLPLIQSAPNLLYDPPPNYLSHQPASRGINTHSKNSANWQPPALLTKISNLPNAFTASSTKFFPVSGFKLLLQKGADVDIQGGYFGNALEAASAGGTWLTVKMLLEVGAEFGSALQAAVANGQNPITTLLLENGAEVKLQEVFLAMLFKQLLLEGIRVL
jgi:ankyrin repeat protein